MDSECRCTIELRVLEDAPLALQVLDAPGAAWSSSEYIPMVTSTLPEYEGPYEAEARFTAQVFATAHKAMTDDFSVHAINYTEAPNESGITVTIGG